MGIQIAADLEKRGHRPHRANDSASGLGSGGLSLEAGIPRTAKEIEGEREKERVHIRYQQRNGRKGLTIIVGLSAELRFKKLVKAMKKEWSTGATIVEQAGTGSIIQVQGDVRRLVGPFLTKLNIVEKAQMTIHGH